MNYTGKQNFKAQCFLLMEFRFDTGVCARVFFGVVVVVFSQESFLKVFLRLKLMRKWVVLKGIVKQFSQSLLTFMSFPNL